MTLSNLMNAFADLGCNQLYVKELAENDNSKNQVYFGPNFAALNIFPNKGIAPTSIHSNPIFYAELNFSWLDDQGGLHPAPTAKMIFYPQYPEARFSGFLKGCKGGPSNLMTVRMRGRLLFLGVVSDGKIIGHVVGPTSSLAREFRGLGGWTKAGLFDIIPLKAGRKGDSKDQLLNELTRIHQLGWIKSKRLLNTGQATECKSPNCGGYTLEAELGITPNGFADPDFLGWEVKQHNVVNFLKYQSSIITLMTPEPTGGIYHDSGVIPFLLRFGYPDRSGIEDRINFGGIHRANQRHAVTNLTLKIVGYDSESGKISDSHGGIALVTDAGENAAFWGFVGMMRHWERKHAQAVYVPSMVEIEPYRRYRYGNVIRLGIGTDFLKFLNALDLGKVYYDPGVKLEHASSSKTVKRRSQFRIRSSDLSALYEREEFVEIG